MAFGPNNVEQSKEISFWTNNALNGFEWLVFRPQKSDLLGLTLFRILQISNACDSTTFGILRPLLSPERRVLAARGRARTIFECGLVDSVSYWTKMCQSPEGQMGQRSMRRKNMGTPMVLGQSRPAWRFRYDFQLLFLYIFGWF